MKSHEDAMLGEGSMLPLTARLDPLSAEPDRIPVRDVRLLLGSESIELGSNSGRLGMKVRGASRCEIGHAG
jgi:hypothetical protein